MSADTMDRVARSAAGSPFVARQEQLAQLQLALERARAGEPALLLSGDAGVGKTRAARSRACRASASRFPA